MTRLAAALVLLTLVVLGGCGGSGGVEAVEGVPFALEVGESATVGGAEVAFLEVVEDSRCPTGAECVWAGKARVRLAVDGGPVVLSVPHSGSDGPEPSTVAVGGLEVAVQSLAPYPAVARPPGPAEVTLVVLEAE